nr:MAG TPA_asm: hypothetical protein [Caudoviricetes sp.]
MATLNPQELATATQAGNPFGGLAATTQHGSALNQPMQPTSTMGSLDQGMYNPTGDAASIVNSHLGTILGSNNALMRNARTQGLEQAASRGLQNSTIAAGAAQRAALDYAMPLVGHAQDTFNQREHRGWQTGERLGSQEWQTGERLGSQDWQTGERALDRTHEFGLQDSRQAWQSGEWGLDRSHDEAMQDSRQQWQTGERIGSQDWQSGESAIERDWRSSEALMERDWRSLEAQLDREFTTEERNAVQAWQSGEAELTREQQVLMANLQEEMNRAQRGWTAEQNQLDRDQQLTMAEVQNWLNNETFMRDFNAQLATMPINNTANLLNFISQQAITNPEIYTPDIVSGMSEFFTTNSMDVLSRYFPNYFQNQGGA